MNTEILAAFESRSLALIRGHGSRELLIEAGARSPLWLPRYRAWSSTQKLVADALARAEARRWPTRVVSPDHLLAAAGAKLAESRGLLW